MKKLFLCLLAITAAISTAWAQTPKKNIFGLRVGMDMSKISILDTGSGEKYLSELRTSFNIGLTDQIRLLNDKPFYFQFGLMLHNKGGKVQATDGGSDIELSLNAMYLELPVMLNYHIRLAPKVAVIPFAGFYGSLGVDGKQSFDDLGLEIQQNLFGKNKMFQRGDFGGRIGIGLSIHSVYIGASYGGFMTQYLLTQTDIFAAAMSHAGISNVTSYWGEGYWGYSYNSVAAAESYPWTDPELFTKQGSLFNADKIHTPLLLIHGTADTNVPIGESIQLFNALSILGRQVEFISVDGGDHTSGSFS